MRVAAFLRAINVGGRVVKMDDLRRLFEAMGLSNVRTVIASGNVVFDTPARSTAKVEAAVEGALGRALGYPVATFLRTLPELVDLAAHPVVAAAGTPADGSVYVAFVRTPPAKDAARKVLALRSDADDFELYDRHVLWTVRGRFLDSRVTSALLEKTLGQPATVRNTTTVRKIAAQYAGK